MVWSFSFGFHIALNPDHRFRLRKADLVLSYFSEVKFFRLHVLGEGDRTCRDQHLWNGFFDISFKSIFFFADLKTVIRFLYFVSGACNLKMGQPQLFLTKIATRTKKPSLQGFTLIISRENRIDRTYIFRSSKSLKFALLGLRKSHLPDHRKTLSGMRD